MIKPIIPLFVKVAIVLVGLLIAAGTGVYWYGRIHQLDEDLEARKVIISWNRLLMDLERFTTGYRAPISARMFAYSSLAAYEASLPGNPGYRTLSGTFGGYEPIPWNGEVPHFLLAASLNTAYAAMARKFFPDASTALQDRINELEKTFSEKNNGAIDKTSLAFSRNYGRRTAENIWRWSQTDSVGYGGLAYCKTCFFKADTAKGHWLPDNDKLTQPLLPYWGKVRSFVVAPTAIISFPPAPYDEAPGSQMYGEAMEVFTSSLPLNSDSHDISEFWSDDIAGLTVTPTGRWISIATQAAERSDLAFAPTMEMYLRLSFALCDAYIVCWELKYQYKSERPQAYISRVIQPDWLPYAPSGPYPSYPAGHAVAAAAAAEILSQTFGDVFSFTDRTHENREEFAGVPRTYQSFRDMAKEIAASRILLGVHFRMDCEEGLRIGTIIGEQEKMLPLR
jgi:hypothetical protein